MDLASIRDETVQPAKAAELLTVVDQTMQRSSGLGLPPTLRFWPIQPARSREHLV